MKYTVIIALLLLCSCSNTSTTDNAEDVSHDTLAGPKPLALESLDMSTYTSYQKSILYYRLQKDRAYKTGEKSPLEADKKGVFTGLNYYAPDSAYRVEVKPVYLKPEPVEFKTSSDRIAMYNKFAELHFSIKGKPLKLIAYVDAEDPKNGLFIPFKDSTTGNATYGAGRFIEMPAPAAGSDFYLDFNDAFNPYCHYNHNYSCPLVPAENVLAVPVEAGEKLLYEQH